MTAAFLAIARAAWPYVLAVVAVIALLLVLASANDAKKAREAARGRAAATIAAGQEKAAGAAAGAVADLSERNEARAAETQENRDAILSTENAGDDAGDAGRVGLERMCRRAINRDDPGCVRLRGQGSAPAPR